MGTSKGFPLPTTGNWPHAKADVTLWASSGGTGSTGTVAVFDSYVAAYGGAQQAASRMRSSTRAGARLGGFYQGVATGGLQQALEDTGLSELGRKTGPRGYARAGKVVSGRRQQPA